MSWFAVLLIITSAFMHALWNFVSKRRSPTLAFFFVAAASGALLVLPLLLEFWRLLPLLPLSVWGLVIATGVAQAVYFSGLAGAYRHGDMSLAYPLARALPVLAVAGISTVLGQGGSISRLSLLGMVLISAGCIVLPLPKFRSVRLSDYVGTIYLMAIVAAAGTTAYTLLDDAALRQLHDVAALSLSNTQITLLFIAVQAPTVALALGLVTWANPAERKRLRAVVANRSLLLTGLVTGFVIMATYGLVLASLAYVRNVSYVAAFRQLSIPIGAVLGLTWAHEPAYRPKVVGIVVISVGLVLVGLG